MLWVIHGVLHQEESRREDGGAGGEGEIGSEVVAVEASE